MNSKKIFICILLLTLAGSNAFAAIGARLEFVDRETSEPIEGIPVLGAFDMDIYLSGAGETAMAAYLVLNFERSKVKITGFASDMGNDLPLPDSQTMNDYNTAGSLILSYSSTDLMPLTADKKLVTVSFSVIAETHGTALFQFGSTSYIKNSEFPPEDVTGTLAQKTLTITPLYKITAAATPAEGGSISDAGEKIYNIAEEPVYTVTVNEGYVIDSFIVSSDPNAALNEKNEYAFAPLAQDATVDVIFKRQYKVTATASPEDGGSISDPGEMLYVADSEPVYTVTVNNGYAIDTFTVSSDPKAVLDEKNQYAFAPIAGDAVVTVTFKRQYKIKASAAPDAGGKISDPGEKIYDAGSKPAYTVTVNPGYAVDSFKVSSDPNAMLNADNQYIFAGLAQHAEISVTFKRQYKIAASVTPPEGGTISNPGESVHDAGSSPVYTVTVNNDYEIETLTVSSDPNAKLENNRYTFPALRGDASISVTFKKVVHNIGIILMPEEGGIADPSGTVSVKDEKDQLVTVKANNGWIIDAVKADGKSVTLDEGGVYTFKKVTRDHILKVIFKKFYTVSVSVTPLNGAVIVPSDKEVVVREGEDQTFTIKPAGNWNIAVKADGKAVSLSPDNTYTFKNVRGNHTLTVESADMPKFYHSADYNSNFHIELNELLRVVQFYNRGEYCCDPAGDDGYKPLPETDDADQSCDQTCIPHNADYDSASGSNMQNWEMELPELMRIIQFYNNPDGYHLDAASEDGFAPGAE